MSSQETVNSESQPPPAQAVEKDRVAGKAKLNVVVREATEADLEDIVSQPVLPNRTPAASKRCPTITYDS